MPSVSGTVRPGPGRRDRTERIHQVAPVVEQALRQPVAVTGTGGARSATTVSAPSTSSGRTVGVVSRTTAVSIAQSVTEPGEPAAPDGS